MTETVLANAKLILPDEIVHGNLRIRGGKITDIAHGATVPPGADDCNGDFISPGLVDMHTDNLERHISPRFGVHWPLAPAIIAHDRELAACGITTVFDSLRLGSASIEGYPSPPDAYPIVSAILRLQKAGVLKIRHRIHLRAEICSQTLKDEMIRFHPRHQIKIVSLMEHIPGKRQLHNITLAEDYMFRKTSMNQEQFRLYLDQMEQLHTQFSESNRKIVPREAARYGACLATHDDATPYHALLGRQCQAAFTEFPTTIAAAQANRDSHIKILAGAPNVVIGKSHSGNISARDLANKGLLDILASDYVPASLLQAVVTLSTIWGNLPKAMATATSVPAHITSLDTGRLAIGAHADLLRFSVHAQVPAIVAVYVSGTRIA